MEKKCRKVTEKQWQEAVDAYELGTESAAQIARRLGVSAAAVSRQFKRRGARKGCRVHETVAELEIELAAKARERYLRRSLKEQAALQRLEEINALVAEMVKSVLRLERLKTSPWPMPRSRSFARY